MRALEHRYFDGPFIALAHRGGSLLAENVGRENTLAAFQRAVDLGYRHLETDVHVTSDGTLISFHDESLDRVTDGSGWIRDHTAAELSAVRVAGEPIPTLDELFEAFPSVCFNIDIKAPGAERPLAEAINRHRAHDRVCVGSFSQSRLNTFRRLVGTQVATSAGPVEVAANLVPGPRPEVGWGRPSAYQVPVRRKVGPVMVEVVTAGFVERAHALGRQVHVWTIDDPDEMNRLIDLGVDGLVSDAIDVLKQVLVARELWH